MRGRVEKGGRSLLFLWITGCYVFSFMSSLESRSCFSLFVSVCFRMKFESLSISLCRDLRSLVCDRTRRHADSVSGDVDSD